MRYEVRVIADENCSEVYDEALVATDDLAQAKREASQATGTFPFGGAILDTATGIIDFGFGFGIEVPDPEL